MTESDEVVVGRNSVTEVLRSNLSVNRVVIRQGVYPETVAEIIELCKQRHIRFETLPSQKIESLPGNPRDVAAFVSPIEYAEIEDIIERAEDSSIVLVLDGIEDPQNLGAIIRSAECFGVDGVIIPKNNACPVNMTVMKTSAGAVTHVPVARVVNIDRDNSFSFARIDCVPLAGVERHGQVLILGRRITPPLPADSEPTLAKPAKGAKVRRKP
ncbi:MAG: hypothetical protein HGA95_01780 [Caldiserica bacterium]|nr:hypothetical protein [Caldisericota bacterium]